MPLPSNEITVISSDKDGADLRRTQVGSKRYIKGDGRRDDQVINEALEPISGKLFLGLGDAWERIFGKKET